jgi:glyoxylase-like metal-dependent hydrolase (beta-lactamase superfamily II)
MTAVPVLPSGVTVFERGWLSSNNVLLRGGGDTTLVDSGYWTHAGQTVALLRQALDGQPLGKLLNTHLHSDHCGGNAALQEAFPEVRTLIPPGLCAQVANWDPVALSYQPTGQYCPRFRFDALARPGEELLLGGHAWQIHGAPGHDPHSVILFDPQTRVLISADALWENGFGIVFPELEGESGFRELAATLDVIEALRPEIVIPGHGAVFSDAGSALGRARRRLDAMVKDPAKHAAHAVKVLLKFKLLELQRLPLREFVTWAVGMPYLALVRERYFPRVEAAQWISDLAQELARSGAAVHEGEFIANA